MNKNNSTFEEWAKGIKTIHPKANDTVLKFIWDFRSMQKNEKAEEMLWNQFECGYCYYFAHMLQAAFCRGEVCWAAPYGHIVWVDENDIPYDISGVCESETDDFIPEYMMGDSVYDFKHIDGIAPDTTEQEIAKMVLDWQDVKSDKFGGDVTKLTTTGAKEYLNRAYVVFELRDQEIYENKRRYLMKKFGFGM